MKRVASTFLIIVSALLLGFYALIWLLVPDANVLTGHNTLAGHDSRTVFVHAIGIAGLAFAVLAWRELRRQREETRRLKEENEEFV